MTGLDTGLDTGALTGVRVRVVGADTEPARQAAAAAESCGAVRLTDGDADQVVVAIDLRAGEVGIGSGTAAGALTGAFTAVRDALADLPDGGGLVLLVATTGHADPTGDAVGALCRSVALEHARRGVRVNTVLVPPGGDCGALVAMLLGPASAMLTGAVLDLT